MAGSLKAYAPLLAWRLGSTPAALYERQRTLVRAGLLVQPEGRGPGSGIQVGPYEVGLLLLTVLATDSLTETPEKVRILAKAKSIADNDICPLTGESTFAEAVARVLDPARDHRKEITGVTVKRTTGIGVINYRGELRSGGSVFTAPKRREAQWLAPTKLRVEATITRDLIIDIRSDLKKLAEAERSTRAAALHGTADSARRIQGQERQTGRVKERRRKGEIKK